MKNIEGWFEGGLWASRFVTLFAVIASLVTSFVMFFIATVDAWYLASHLLDYVSPDLADEARMTFRASVITHVVEIVDGYLLATVLLIFALGLYELFISKIEAAEKSESATNVLIIHSLDDLKTRLSKVILMILIVKYFEHAVSMEFSSPMDLLFLAGGIALIGLALYLTHEKSGHETSDEKKEAGH